MTILWGTLGIIYEKLTFFIVIITWLSDRKSLEQLVGLQLLFLFGLQVYPSYYCLATLHEDIFILSINAHFLVASKGFNANDAFTDLLGFDVKTSQFIWLRFQYIQFRLINVWAAECFNLIFEISWVLLIVIILRVSFLHYFPIWLTFG